MLKFKEFILEIKKPEQIESERNALKEYLSNKHPFHKLSQNEKHYVRKYTQYSGELNEHLYNQHTNNKAFCYNTDKMIPYNQTKLSKILVAETSSKIQHIDSAISKNKMKKSFATYTGIKFNPGEEASKHPNRLVNLPAYTSTSLNKNIAQKFAKVHEHKNSNLQVKHVLKINIKKNNQALPVLDSTYHSNKEDEIVLPRHTTIKIADKPHRIEKQKDVYNNKPIEIHHWNAEIVHQGED